MTTCLAHGCLEEVEPPAFFCERHWGFLPREGQHIVATAWSYASKADALGSPMFHEAIRAAQLKIAQVEAREPGTAG